CAAAHTGGRPHRGLKGLPVRPVRGRVAAMPRLHAPTIATERLVLDPITPGHAEEMAGVLAGPGLYTHIGGRPPTAADLRRRYTAWAAGAPDPQVSWCNWAVRAGGRAVGTVQATV